MQEVTLTDAIDIVKREIPCTDYLEKGLHDKENSNMYCCPECESGTGKHGTGALQFYPKNNDWYCHKCHKHGDSIDLHMKKHDCDFMTAVIDMAASLNYKVVYNEYNEKSQNVPVNIQTAAETLKRKVPPTHSNDSLLSVQSNKRHENRADVTTHHNNDNQPLLVDYSTYYSECAARIEEKAAVDYLKSRGISIATAKACFIGYDPEWVSPTALDTLRDEGNTWTPPATRRIIVPMTDNSYFARAIDQHVEKRFQKMNETGRGDMGLFNTYVLSGYREVCFICEGAFSTLSVIECGYNAIGINSEGNADKLIRLLEQKRPNVETFVICLDNDDAGVDGTKVLMQGLTRLNISYVAINVSGEYNDPNDRLVADKEGFEKALHRAERKALKKPDSMDRYIDTLMLLEIERNKKADNITTGFKYLDQKSGGLNPGLYVIAATSSLGKTTFALQMADNLAESGHDVLFFSLEQSRLELVTKSFSRLTYEQGAPVSALSLRKGRHFQVLKEVIRDYKARIGKNISIIEGNFNCDISFVGKYIRGYIKQNGNNPIVFIDYLQILKPTKEQGKRESIDDVVTELRRISREHDLTIIVISSINRNNYLMPIDFESLKESGGIEYTADVVWGLQLQCLNEDLFNQDKKIKQKRERIKAAKRAEPREIELVCLKNRYGISNFTCNFEYMPRFDCFDSVPDNPEPLKAGRKAGRKAK